MDTLIGYKRRQETHRQPSWMLFKGKMPSVRGISQPSLAADEGIIINIIYKPLMEERGI